MFNIRDFLKKATNKQTKNLFFRKVVEETLKRHVNIEVPPESISIKSSIIGIKNISQGARSAIFIKKQAILEDLNKVQDIFKVKDIR